MVRHAKGLHSKIRYPKEGGWQMTYRPTWVEDRALATHGRPRAMHPVMARTYPKVATRVFLARLLMKLLLVEVEPQAERLTWESTEDDRPPVAPLDNLIEAAPNAPGIWA